MSLKRISLFCVFLIFFVFQNCSQTPVDLSRVSSLQLRHSTVDIKGNICLDQGFHLKSFFIVNLSMKPEGNSLFVDADRDGLNDVFEMEHGFDSSVARSSGSMLDQICFYLTNSNDCHDLGVECEEKENEMGFSDCDINALELGYNNTTQLGLDSDDDGIPDKIEVHFELDPKNDDALTDYDNDGITNKAEVLQATHPRQESSTIPQVTSLITRKLEPQEVECSGEAWVFHADKRRVYDLGHPTTGDLGKNHFWIMALSEKREDSLVVGKKTQYIKLERHYLQPHETLMYSSDDFMVADNGFFRGASQ